MPAIPSLSRPGSPPAQNDGSSNIGPSFSALTLDTVETGIDPDLTALPTPSTAMGQAGRFASDFAGGKGDQPQSVNREGSSMLTYTERSGSLFGSNHAESSHSAKEKDDDKQAYELVKIMQESIGDNVDEATQEVFKNSLKARGYTEHSDTLDPRTDDDVWCWTKKDRGLIYGCLGVFAAVGIVGIVWAAYMRVEDRRKIRLREDGCLRIVQSRNTTIEGLRQKEEAQQQRIDYYDKVVEDLTKKIHDETEAQTLADQETDIRNFQKDNERLRTELDELRAALAKLEGQSVSKKDQ